MFFPFCNKLHNFFEIIIIPGLFGENKYGFCFIVGGISLTFCFQHSFRFAVYFHCGKVLCLNRIPKATDETSFITLGTEHHTNKLHLIWLSREELIYIILMTLIPILSGAVEIYVSHRLSPVLLEFLCFNFSGKLSKSILQSDSRKKFAVQ